MRQSCDEVGLCSTLPGGRSERGRGSALYPSESPSPSAGTGNQPRPPLLAGAAATERPASANMSRRIGVIQEDTPLILSCGMEPFSSQSQSHKLVHWPLNKEIT